MHQFLIDHEREVFVFMIPIFALIFMGVLWVASKYAIDREPEE